MRKKLKVIKNKLSGITLRTEYYGKGIAQSQWKAMVRIIYGDNKKVTIWTEPMKFHWEVRPRESENEGEEA